MDPITLAVVAVAAYFIFFKGPSPSSSNQLEYESRTPPPGTPPPGSGSRTTPGNTNPFSNLPVDTRTTSTDASGRPAYAAPAPAMKFINLDFGSLNAIANELAAIPDSGGLRTKIDSIIRMVQNGVDLSLFPYDPNWLDDLAAGVESQFGATNVAAKLRDIASNVRNALGVVESSAEQQRIDSLFDTSFPALAALPDLALFGDVRGMFAGIQIAPYAGRDIVMIEPGADLPPTSLVQDLRSRLALALGESSPAVAAIDKYLHIIESESNIVRRS